MYYTGYAITPDFTTDVHLYLLDEMYQEFVDHPKMVPIRDRTVWVHVEVPGQGHKAPDLPSELVPLWFIQYWL